MTNDNDLAAFLLVVDDEEGMRETLRDILEEYDYRADTASNGKEAVDKVKTANYDLVLMDVKMPVMDGIEALRSMRMLRPRLPVIMMTAYSSSATVDAACHHGAEMILNKPLDLGEILAVVQRSPRRRGA